jgi:hypothetical protein
MSVMTSVALHTTGFVESPKLRLLPRGGKTARRADTRRGPLRLLGSPSSRAQRVPQDHPVLLAGGEQSDRTAVLSDLAGSMPPSTSFEQANAIWEVLARAPQSKMVILSGELEGIPAQALMQLLGHRHPEVPVVCVDAASHAAA